MASIVNNRLSSAVNNGRRDPLQGFDVNVYIQDQGTGNLLPFGEFTGFQHTVRNATEPYLPLGHRSLSLLDGEFQIGWVAEGGKINVDALKDTIGYEYIGPVVRIGRSPRFQIVVEYNAAELEAAEGNAYYGAEYVSEDFFSDSGKAGTGGVASPLKRAATGRYVFSFCKVDAYTSGAMAGRSVIADRIEGLASGLSIETLDTPVFKKSTLLDSSASTTASTYNGRNIVVPTFSTFGKLPTWATA